MVHHKIMSVMGLCVCLIELRNCSTHWGRMMHICVGNLTIIVSDNGLSPYRRQAIIWTNAGILLIGPLGTNFSAILIRIQTFSFKKMHLKMLSAKWRPFRLSLNVLRLMPLHTTCCNWDSLIITKVTHGSGYLSWDQHFKRCRPVKSLIYHFEQCYYWYNRAKLLYFIIGPLSVTGRKHNKNQHDWLFIWQKRWQAIMWTSDCLV